MSIVKRRRGGKITRIKARMAKERTIVMVGDRLHETFYDADGTLQSHYEIDKQRLGSRGEGRSYKV